MISAKYRLLARGTAAILVALAFGAGTAYAKEAGALVVAQAQPEPSADTPATSDDTIAPAAGQGEAPGGAEAPASGDADTAATPSAGQSPDAATKAEPSGDAPADTSTDASDKADSQTTTAPDSSGSADVAPVQPEAPAAASTDSSADVEASKLQIGAAVFGADGAKIGEVNGVKSDTSGKVQEILVTDGVAAGINAKVFAIPADKIASVSDGVKLSLSSEEAKKLPVVDNGNG
jgi:sporulation protein YlmC with PRC-barrel domain